MVCIQLEFKSINGWTKTQAAIGYKLVGPFDKKSDSLGSTRGPRAWSPFLVLFIHPPISASKR